MLDFSLNGGFSFAIGFYGSHCIIKFPLRDLCIEIVQKSIELRL